MIAHPLLRAVIVGRRRGSFAVECVSREIGVAIPIDVPVGASPLVPENRGLGGGGRARGRPLAPRRWLVDRVGSLRLALGEAHAVLVLVVDVVVDVVVGCRVRMGRGSPVRRWVHDSGQSRGSISERKSSVPCPVPFRARVRSKQLRAGSRGAIVSRLCRRAARDLGDRRRREGGARCKKCGGKATDQQLPGSWQPWPVSPGERTAKAASAFPESTPNPGRRNFAKIATRLPRFDLLVWCHRGLSGGGPRAHRARSGTSSLEGQVHLLEGAAQQWHAVWEPRCSQSFSLPVAARVWVLRQDRESRARESGGLCRGLMGLFSDGAQEPDSRHEAERPRVPFPNPGKLHGLDSPPLNASTLPGLALLAPCFWFREIGKYEKKGSCLLACSRCSRAAESHRTEAMSAMEHCRSWTRIGLDWVPGACPSAAFRARVALPCPRGASHQHVSG